MIDCNGLARIERKNILFVKSRAVQTISPLPPFDQSYDNQIRITDGLFYLFIIYFAYIMKRNNDLGEIFIFYYVFFIYLFISLISFVYRTSVGNAFMLSH